MRLLFKQRMFAWFDSYDIYREDGSVAYTVKGEPAWGHSLRIFDAQGNEAGQVKQKIFTFLPKFDLYCAGRQIGKVCKKWSWLHPKYYFESNGWTVEGTFTEWDYQILDAKGELVAKVSKELWNWTDTYVLDIREESNALLVLMFTLAIDAEKCSRN